MSKKTKRGKRGKAKATVPEKPRETAFIATESGPERVFPREIRNKIYRYLLTGPQVQVHPRGNPQEIRVHSYRFGVNILRANKAINEEAADILYKENDFIVVSAKELYFDTNMEAFAMPIITKNASKLKSFDQHVLEFRFTNDHETGSDRRCFCKDCLRPRKESKYLIHGSDLDVFIRFCRTVNHMVDGGRFAVVSSPRDGSFDFFRQNEKPASTTITFRETTHSAPTPAFIAGVATQLRKLVGARQVTIEGVIDPSLALDLQRTMIPKVVWGYAIGWDMVELLHSWKTYADELAEDGGNRGHADGAALQIFSLVEQVSARCLVMHMVNSQGTMNAYSRDLCNEWVEAFQYLRFDACLSLALIQLHLTGDLQRATKVVTEAAKCTLYSCHVPPESLSKMHHIMALVMVHEGKCSEAHFHMEQAKLEMEMAGLSIDPKFEGELKKHQTHIAKHNKRPGGEVADRACRKICCSVLGNEPATVKTRFHGKRPDGLVGWQDTYHKLTADDLKAMGVHEEDVPPRVDVKVERPRCHLRS